MLRDEVSSEEVWIWDDTIGTLCNDLTTTEQPMHDNANELYLYTTNDANIYRQLLHAYRRADRILDAGADTHATVGLYWMAVRIAAMRYQIEVTRRNYTGRDLLRVCGMIAERFADERLVADNMGIGGRHDPV